MSLDIKIGNRVSKVKLISKENNKVKIKVDNKIYELDIVMVENGVYSILYNNISYNVELTENGNYKKYLVTTLYNSLNVEIIDSETKYRQSRKKDEMDEEVKISSPMPGKVVKIPVKVGDKINAGETVIIISAMKMESEYKVKTERVVKEILVKEGQTINGNQTLIVVE